MARSSISGRATLMEGSNLTNVRNLRVSVPPLGLQHTFASSVSDIRQAMLAQQERIAAASERLVQSLMGTAFDG